MNQQVKKHPTSYFTNCLIACSCLLVLSTHAWGNPRARASQDEDIPINFAEGKNYRVKVDIVQPIRTSDGQLLYRLSYNYQFKERPTINIKSIGMVPASGKQEHLFAGEYLEFEDASGNLLVRIRLKPNKKAPEAGALDLPSESEFVSFLSETAQDQGAFLPKALQKLNRWFPAGYTIRQDGQVTSLMTIYRDVEGLPSNLRGQIAIRLSYPYDPNSNQFFFRVYMVTRQRPKKSADWQSPSPETQKVFDNFVRQLLQEFKD
jgi:hypothetical protein